MSKFVAENIESTYTQFHTHQIRFLCDQPSFSHGSVSSELVHFQNCKRGFHEFTSFYSTTSHKKLTKVEKLTQLKVFPSFLPSTEKGISLVIQQFQFIFNLATRKRELISLSSERPRRHDQLDLLRSKRNGCESVTLYQEKCRT